jgi:hypothetical protein
VVDDLSGDEIGIVPKLIDSGENHRPPLQPKCPIVQSALRKTPEYD